MRGDDTRIELIEQNQKKKMGWGVFTSQGSIYIYIFIILLLIIGALVSPNFFSISNFTNILRAVSLLGMVAVGVSFITYSGHYADLSVPSIMAFSGIIAVEALSLGLIPALFLGILAGLAIGFINGMVVGYLRANPILWTLAVAFAMEGFMRFTWSNTQIYPDTAAGSPGAAFINLFRVNLGPFPLIVLVMLLFFIAGHLVMNKTKFGIQTKLVGSAIDVARCTGVDVPKTVRTAFMMAAFAASIAGIFLTSMNRMGVFYLGEGYDFRSVTAIVIGGVTLAGGRGSMAGVLGGVLVIGLLTNIMTFMGIGTFVQGIFTGIIFIAVVGFNSYYLRKLGKDYE